MKYSLINTKTRRKIICEKVTFKGHDYFVSDDKQLIGESSTFLSKENLFKNFFTESEDRIILATTNPVLYVPKIVEKPVNYNYEKLGKQMIDEALKKFLSVHGYGLNKKGEGGDYLYFSYFEVVGDVLYLHYDEETRHDTPYSVTLELPSKSEDYPVKKEKQVVLYNEEEVRKIFEIAQSQKDYGDFKPYTFEECMEIFENLQPEKVYCQ